MATVKQTTIRLGPEDVAILEEIQRRTGVFNRSDALRYALRQYAASEGIEVTAKPRPKGK